MVEKQDPRTGAVIGIDLGGTKLSGALFSEEGEIIHRSEILHGGIGGSETGSLVVKLLQEHELFAADRNYRLDSVGICVPGISHQKNRSVWAPNIPGWEAYPLYQEVRDGLKNSAIPVSIESDRNCYILGEMWKGKARHGSNVIFIAVGTGIGIGMVANGQIINGENGIAGAIGWMALDRPYSKAYDPCGHFEYHASGTGIARRAESLLSKGEKSKFLHAGKLSARDVFDAYAKNDPVASEVIEQSIAYWGMAVANLVSILNPEKIIFGGGLFGPAIQLLDRIYEEAGKWAQPIAIQEVKLLATSLNGDAGLYGAGYLAIKNKLLHEA